MRPALAVALDALGVLPTSDFRRCLNFLADKLAALRESDDLDALRQYAALREALSVVCQIQSDRERHAAMLELAAREGWSGGGRA